MNGIRETSDRYVYEVPSRTEPGKFHRCDLTANKGAGHCSCIGFAAHRQPALDRGETPLSNATLCHHLKSAFWHFLREIMPRLAKEEQTERRAG